MTWPPQDTEIHGVLQALLPELRAIRRDLHAHPELGFEETRTQGRVRAFLEERGYEPRALAGTGLVADLRPDLAKSSIALRADLDCLPMEETTDLPHRSRTPGRAHKCGHDGHTAILLGVAAALASSRESAPGNVRLVFQPAEEGVRGGGARPMIEQGVLQGVREIYGLHNWPAFPWGSVRVRGGPMMARTHEIAITVRGEGGHGSAPDQCRDPIVAACALVSSLQTAVSRSLGHSGGAVVSICRFQSGSASNVIPATAELHGTMRSFDDAVTEKVLQRIHEIARGIAIAHQVDIDVRLSPGYPVLHNDDECAEAVVRAAGRVFARSDVTSTGLPIAGAEDFAYYTQSTRGAYFFLGAGRSATTPACHHPDFDFDDELIVPAARTFIEILRDRAAHQVFAGPG